MVLRSKEKRLVFMVLAALTLVFFVSVFFLPDRSIREEHANKVYKVYKELRMAGRDLVLPAPPRKSAEGSQTGGLDNPVAVDPNVHHGQPVAKHTPDDKAKLLARVELDAEINKLHRKQQEAVLPKPIIKVGEKVHVSPKQVEEKAKSDGEIINDDSVLPDGVDPTSLDKRNKVLEMMKHAWKNYEKHAWGFNELKPMSKRGHTSSIFGRSPMGATIVDGMDTLYIMGLHEYFKKGRDWIERSLDFSRLEGDISVFETCIRYVGGLLTLYSFTGDEMFKNKTVHIVDKLMPAFKTPTGIPYSMVNVQTGLAKNFPWASGGSSILSEFGTLHMEFTYLSDITGNPKYREAVEKIRKVIKAAERPKSLYPNYLNPRTGKWGQQHTSVGALGDSFYEYLLKEWLRSGKKDVEAKRMFDSAALDIEKQLIAKSASGLTYITEWKYGRQEHKMDHLACFAGGMYGLAAREEMDGNSVRWMNIAKGITETCHESYDRTATKLGPEAFHFSNRVEARTLKQNEKYYILRPETVESYFIMWRLTHDQKYRDWGWEAVQALEKHCRVEGGFSGIRNVYDKNSAKDDVQQSFFLAETLKYLYLLFSDDNLIALDKWVFNTEAHPLPIKGDNTVYRQANTTN